MLTEMCEYLKNYFDTDQPKRIASFTIQNGKVQGIEDMLAVGQYYRIVGSLFNDGVFKYGTEADENLTDEVFDGAIWAMAVPKRAVKLADDIAAWEAQYGKIDSEAMSPYQSESFGGYSYTKKGGDTSSDGISDPNSWQAAFKSRLARWRKI